MRDAFISPMGTKRRLLWLALCAAQLSFLAYLIYFYTRYHYLPSPFLSDKFDTFMDLFNPMFWADKDARYSEWGSVYPPFSFLFLNAMRGSLVGDLAMVDPFWLRDHARSVQIFLVAAYLLIPVFVITRGYWRKFATEEKFYIYLIIILSAPMLFALERGNLIIFALGLLPLLFSGSPYVRLLGLVFLVNIKPYFVVLIFAYAIKRRWSEFALAIAATGGFYLLTCLLLGNDPFLMLINLFSYSQQNALFSPREVLAMPSSISAFSYVLSFQKAQNVMRHASIDTDFLIAGIEAAKLILYALAVACLALYGRRVPLKILFAVFLLMIANLGVSVGGYTLVFLVALVPVLCGMRYRVLYIVALLLMALPLDMISWIRDTKPFMQFSYLGRQNVATEWTLGFGSILRPVVDFLLLAGITSEIFARRVLACQASTNLECIKNGE